MIERKINPTAKIAVFAVVHGVYFEQFEGLFESLSGFHKDLIGIVEKNGVEVVDFGMVDSSERAFKVADEIQAAGVDLIICNMITYATSSVFAPFFVTAQLP